MRRRVTFVPTWALPIPLALSVVACGGSRGAAPVADGGGPADVVDYSCPIAAPTVCPDPMPVYSTVAPIFQQRCEPCHQGLPNGPWPLTMRQHFLDWEDLVRSAMLDCSMPPADGGLPLPTEERRAILTWIRCGLPP